MPQMNHITQLSPVGQVPQISPAYTQLSAVKNLESQMPTVDTSSATYTTPQNSHTPMPSYSMPSVAPFEHVQAILKPYHSSLSAVKHIEQQMNSVVPMQSVSPVTAYNPMTSATAYAQMSSVAPFEHIQTIVKPYPVYIKEEQHPPTYVIEQPPSPPPPPSSHPSIPSNFWHPETFVYNKPTFTYHNGPCMLFLNPHQVNRFFFWKML